jgi:acid phosphatase (class A)
MPDRYLDILIDVSNTILKKDINSIRYEGFYVEYPIPDIIDFDWKNILKAPPANDSALTKKELLYLSNLTNRRTKEDEQIVYNIDSQPEYYILEIIKTYNLQDYSDKIREFYNIIKPILLNIKSLFSRPRPYQLAEYFGISINTIDTLTHHTGSYPSGHTVYSYLYYRILSYYYPEHRERLKIAAQKTMLGRELQGVHYPSDNNASIILANVLFNNLYKKVLI